MNPSLYSRIDAYLKYNLKDQNCKKFLFDFESYKKNDFQRYKNEISFDNLVANNELLSIIVNDDVNKLIEYVDSDSYKTKTTKNDKVFSIPYYLRKSKEIIEIACYFGSINCLNHLLENYIAKRNSNLQYYAIQSGNLEIIRILDEKGFDFIDYLQYACYFHQNDIFFWILNEKKHLIFNKINLFNKCLIECAKSDNLKLFVYCLDSKANISYCDDQKRNCLSYACEYNNEEIVYICLETKSSISNKKDISGSTPLHHAVRNYHKNIVEILLSFKDVDLTIKDSFEKTAFDYANDEIKDIFLANEKLKQSCE
ncbi:ankyrin repeat protein, putative [Trichomonas vaginalis G3]|uniref:Ankyrin repeat protein, putative n=1 Tax=Trichomonas vaginalis (strain ATCC PRA-98 / G3) TaxID=412133 RepID=A2FMP6_TRIV3|nr:Ankyrin repeat family [Trichomonas vaginalis G3]EAX93803.1 ankyrin repeat protein, putative [Trichomonas vaginalis G3]KAI5486358.1 Ankyrin repeat family [Trichomonas vaginalis G3]|eukprot:XP_001306733.1 ankyrin repeat protein [Trichomonas vaginalis G3]